MNVPVPVISLKDNNDTITKQIVDACYNTGFFFLIDHGLEDDAKKMFEYAKEFFSLDLNEKMKLLNTAESQNRGYTPLHGELLNSSQIDCKEAFNVLSPDIDVAKYWPESENIPSDFKQNVQKFYRSLHALGLQILAHFEKGLGKESGFLSEHHKNHGPTTLRFLKYPTQTEQKNGAGPHSDYGTMTFLFQDMVGGLQIKDKNNEKENWIDVVPVKDAICCNVGDLLMKWTENKFQSTVHKVIIGANRPERYSIAYFYHPVDETVVGDVTAGEYLKMKLDRSHVTRK
jgi:isopenicillin N synthase-like dioxygenase